ncbi:hypothetical protein BS78_K177100 [Paspalum vaginatum]|uniref:Uncharacterized protein n=1 Tax=Paspalum vaginatum TaxID=158149 RepID=A0A9W7XBR1_9POAL|nr:hypothetical protein BS78_K177100 [Paspalum vaginatum]
MRPLREEFSTIKLWLARMTNHFECVAPCGGHAQDFDIAQLFGPYSPVRHSPSPSMLTSLAVACLPVRSLEGENSCGNTTDAPSRVHGVMNPITHEIATTEQVVVTPAVTYVEEQTIDAPIVEQATVAPTDSHVEEVVLVEDASDDEDVVSAVTIENPIFLTIIEDVVTHSTVEVKLEVPQLLQDPHLQGVPSPAAEARMNEDLARPSIQPPSPPTMIARRQRKSFDSSSCRRSARLAQRNALKELGIIGSDGKLNDEIIQVYSDRLKELVPPDLLKPLLSLKGRAFWDFLAEGVASSFVCVVS